MAESQTAAAPWSSAIHQLSRPWLGWCVVLLVIVAVWVPLLAAQYNSLANPPASADSALRAAAVSATGHAVYHTVLDVAFGAGAIAVAGLVLSRSPRQPLATAVALGLTVWGPLNGLATEATLSGASWGISLAMGAWGVLAILVWRAVRRYHVGNELRTRQQLRWLFYGLALSALLMGVVFGALGNPLWLDANQVDRRMTAHLLQVMVGACAIGSVWAGWISRSPRDPDTLIRRTMVYGALTGIVAGGTVVLVFIPAVLYYELGPVYLLFVVCAWSILGLRLQQAVQRAVNRMLYGQRDEPGAVLTDLGSRLELGSPETVLSTIVETVSTALKLPGVSIRAADGTTLASTGNTVLEPVRVAILHQGDVQGDLFASPRARDEGLDERDMEVLRLVARQAGPTVHAVQLTQELRRSRQDILSGREEERRRIRRDLHDGLGPALAAIAMQVDTARAIVDDDPDGARDLLSAVTLQAEEVVAEVRRLVYDLRPPALDQLGLVGAIERLAAQTCTSSLTVSVEAAPELPRLPAATEVAVYRIVAEALTNAARHARATLCRVAIHVSEGALSVVIEDDGVGIVPGVARGIGLKSMEDRATEVGGALGIEPRQGGGTTVSGSFRLDSMGQAK
jgi:signal transduction histidine kinase